MGGGGQGSVRRTPWAAPLPARPSVPPVPHACNSAALHVVSTGLWNPTAHDTKSRKTAQKHANAGRGERASIRISGWHARPFLHCGGCFVPLPTDRRVGSFFGFWWRESREHFLQTNRDVRTIGQRSYTHVAPGRHSGRGPWLSPLGVPPTRSPRTGGGRSRRPAPAPPPRHAPSLQGVPNAVGEVAPCVCLTLPVVLTVASHDAPTQPKHPNR